LSFLALISVSVAGCNSASGTNWDVVPVSGTVTLDGQPLADAQVSLIPETRQDGYPGAAAKTDSAGKFTLISGNQQGAMPGKYKVIVSKLTMKDGSPLVDQGEGMDVDQLIAQGLTREAVPPQYSDPSQTTLAMDVVSGKAEGYDIQMTSK
jgi:hypothetical protein